MLLVSPTTLYDSNQVGAHCIVDLMDTGHSEGAKTHRDSSAKKIDHISLCSPTTWR